MGYFISGRRLICSRMNRLVLVAALAALALAQDNSTVSSEDICVEYAECMEKAQTKSSECTATESVVEIHGKKANCNEAKQTHGELQKMFDERNTKMVSCVREKSTVADALTGKKAEKCVSAYKKLAKRTSMEPAKREKRKDKRDKKDKAGKSCAKEAKRLRAHCVKIAKCCSVAKECNAQTNTEEINAKKKELKEVMKQCGGKEHNKKGKGKHHKKEKKTDDGAPEPKKLKKEEKFKEDASKEIKENVGVKA